LRSGSAEQDQEDLLRRVAQIYRRADDLFCAASKRATGSKTCQPSVFTRNATAAATHCPLAFAVNKPGEGVAPTP
jgi:hypothetical protein